MNRLLIVFGLVLALAGCASGVKLDEAPVEDKSGTAAQPAPAPAAASSAVATIRASNLPAVDPGPTGVSKVIYFDYDSFVIKADSQTLIEAHARYLRADKNRRISIEGHADERGGREYNLALGQKRSEAVRKALGLLGVPDSQIEAVSFGKEKPSDPGHDEAAWAKNRRAEIAYR
ncbi:MAG: putative peptidoglycan-associated lipoprotein precursor [Pseudomonadota bacterium]